MRVETHFDGNIIEVDINSQNRKTNSQKPHALQLFACIRQEMFLVDAGSGSEARRSYVWLFVTQGARISSSVEYPA